MIKNRTYSIDAAIKYNVGVRTIQRKVNQLEKENPELIRIYKAIKTSNKIATPIPENLEEKISQLVERPVKIGDINSTRKEQLEKIEKIFNSRCKNTSKQQAASSMGFSMNRIYKSLNELYRMRIEEEYSRMEDSFRESLKVEGQKPIEASNNVKNTETQIPKEGEER